MESQPQNPEFRINPENFHPCIYKTPAKFQKDQDKTVRGVALTKHTFITKNSHQRRWQIPRPKSN